MAKRHRNGSRTKEWRADRRIDNRIRAIELLGGKCVQCGYCDDIDGLEIDHITPRSQDPESIMASRKDGSKYRRSFSNLLVGVSWERVEKELAKCQLLCGTCHSIKTRRENRQRFLTPKTK